VVVYRVTGVRCTLAGMRKWESRLRDVCQQWSMGDQNQVTM
jgi:hypothetical protein